MIPLKNKKKREIKQDYMSDSLALFISCLILIAFLITLKILFKY